MTVVRRDGLGLVSQSKEKARHVCLAFSYVSLWLGIMDSNHCCLIQSQVAYH